MGSRNEKSLIELTTIILTFITFTEHNKRDHKLLVWLEIILFWMKFLL